MWAAAAGAEAAAVAYPREDERGDKGRRGALPAEIVQDAAGNLHPFGLHDEDPQQKQCIPAPRGRGPRVRHGDSGAPESGRRLQRGRAGAGARPAHLRPAPSALDPRGWAEARGGAPGLNAPVLLEQPNGKLENREPGHAGPMRRSLIGPSSPIRLQGAQLLLRKPTSRRL